MNHDASPAHRTRIWDLPTRVFHWTLAICVVGLVISGNIGGSAMIWHFRFGQAVMTLLMFRLLWGIVGGHWSRFSSLPLRPSALADELRAGAKLRTGHGALGSLAVLAFGLVLLAQVGSGLISDDEIAFAGPLTHLVSGATVGAASAYHKNVGKLLLIGLVLLHLVAVIWHTFKGHAIVSAMVHGDKRLQEVTPASRDDWRTRLLAVVLLAACVAASTWVFGLAPAI